MCGSRLLIDGSRDAVVKHLDQDVVGSRCAKRQHSNYEQRPQTDEWVHLARGAREGKRHPPLANLNDTTLQAVEPAKRARWPGDPIRIPAPASPGASSIGSFSAVVGERPFRYARTARVAGAEHVRRYRFQKAAQTAVGVLRNSPEAAPARDERDQGNKSHRARNE